MHRLQIPNPGCKQVFRLLLHLERTDQKRIKIINNEKMGIAKNPTKNKGHLKVKIQPLGLCSIEYGTDNVQALSVFCVPPEVAYANCICISVLYGYLGIGNKKSTTY
jgi:hypothetical protein